MTARVRISGKDSVFDAPEGEDLLEILQHNGHPIATSCGGVASCGLCRVTIVSGKDLLSPIKSIEITHLGNVAKVIGMRLACQSHIAAPDGGEIVVSVPDVEDTEERKRRKAERLRAERRAPRSERPPPSPSSDPARPLRAVIEWRPRRVPPKEE